MSTDFIAARCYASAAYVDRRAVSVCVSVCPSRSYILSKRINVSSNIFYRRVATPSWFFQTKRHGNIPTGTTLTVECKWCRQKSRFWANIWLHCMLWTLQPPGAVNTIVGRYPAIDRCLLELVLSTDGRPSSGVSQSRCKSVCDTESHSPVNSPKRREENELVYAAVNLTREYN